MKGKPSPRVCSVADALAIVGDRYSLLIVREIGYGYRRFGELAEFTGAPRDVLERRQYCERPPRFEYHLTEPGAKLRPIVLALKEWGDSQLNAGAEPVVFKHTCGAEFHPLTVCAACRQPIADGELEVTGGTDPIEGEPW